MQYFNSYNQNFFLGDCQLPPVLWHYCVPFIAQLKKEEFDKANYQQTGATAYTAHMSMSLLDDMFADRIISKTIWPPRSPDLSLPYFFFLWVAMNNSVYSNNPHTIDELKTAITIRSECGPCCTEHCHREHSSACQ